MSTGINHNIDELLVGIVTQIRLKQVGKEGERRSRVDKVGTFFLSPQGGRGNKVELFLKSSKFR